MADPVSLLACVLGTLEIGTRLTTALNGVLRTWKTAPAEILAIHNEISDLNIVLNYTRNALPSKTQHGENALRNINFREALLKEVDAAKEILDDIDNSISIFSAMQKIKRRVYWLKHNGNIEAKKGQLRSIRIRINELLSTYNVYVCFGSLTDAA
jgi:hypothetical protein